MRTATIGSAHTDYHGLADRVRQAGLLDRRPFAYGVKISLTLFVFGAGWVALLAVSDSWAALAVAAWLAVVFTHVVFLGPDAGHQQIFVSRRANSVGTGNDFSYLDPELLV